MVIAEVGRFILETVFQGIGEWVVRTFSRLRGEEKSYGEGTTAALEIQKRRARRQEKRESELKQ